MQAIVLRPFKDKLAGKVHKQGAKIKTTEERLTEINGAALGPFLQVIAEDKPAKKKTTKKSKK